MRITFSFNQVSQIQLNAVRGAEVCELVRKYLCLVDGQYLCSADAMSAIVSNAHKSFIDECGCKIVYILGEPVDLAVAVHALLVNDSLEQIQHKLNELARSEISVSAVQKAVRYAKDLIDATEW